MIDPDPVARSAIARVTGSATRDPLSELVIRLHVVFEHQFLAPPGRRLWRRPSIAKTGASFAG